MRAEVDIYAIKQCLRILTGIQQHLCQQCVARVPLMAYGNKANNSLIQKQWPGNFPRRQYGCYLSILVNRRIELCRDLLFHISWYQFRKKVLEVFKLIVLLYPSLLNRSNYCISCLCEEYQTFFKKKEKALINLHTPHRQYLPQTETLKIIFRTMRFSLSKDVASSSRA